MVHVNRHLMGSRLSGNDLPAVNSELQLEINIQDDDEAFAEYDIDVFSGAIGGETAEIIETVAADGNGTFLIEDIHYEGGFQYVFLRVRQSGDHEQDRARAWTAPVWFEPAGVAAAPPSLSPSPTAVVNFVASRRSKIYHVDPNCRDARRIKSRNLLRGQDAVQGRQPHQNCPR